nr:MAG TPA: hypothetical protein [Caudoviricetes sp.]
MARVPFSNSKEKFKGGGRRQNLHYGAREGFLKIKTKNKQNAPFFATAPERWRR